MKVSVAAIATNAGFELFAKPAPAAAVNVALHAHAPASARAADPRRAPSTDRVLDTGTGSHGPDHPASVVNAMVDSVADRIDDVRTAFAGAFAAAGRTITAPLAALRAGRQTAVAVALLVTVAGVALAFARDFDTLGVIAGGALVVAAVTVMAVAAGTLVRGGSGRQTGG